MSAEDNVLDQAVKEAIEEKVSELLTLSQRQLEALSIFIQGRLTDFENNSESIEIVVNQLTMALLEIENRLTATIETLTETGVLDSSAFEEALDARRKESYEQLDSIFNAETQQSSE